MVEEISSASKQAGGKKAVNFHEIFVSCMRILAAWILGNGGVGVTVII
jgi:hypothetical protein